MVADVHQAKLISVHLNRVFATNALRSAISFPNLHTWPPSEP